MPNTTPSPLSFESINISALADVSGGCGGGKKSRGCNCNNQQSMIVNNYAAPQAQPPMDPIAQPQPQPQQFAPPPPSSSVDTNVSVSYA